jgi:amino acid adenylation domain-containing protein
LSASALLARLEILGVKLDAEGDRLRANAVPGVLSDDLKREIGANKTELIELLAQRANVGDALAPISRERPLPLSLFQERLWVMQQLEPENTSFLLAAAWLAPTKCDVNRVVAAIKGLQSRHEILRSVFTEIDGSPCVRLIEAPRANCHDLSGLPPIEQERGANEGIHRTLQGPVDLGTRVPRFEVYNFGQDWVGVVLAAHHIALDAWSIGLLFQELAVLVSSPERTDLPANRFQYVDYAAWQRKKVRSDSGELDWWTQRLSGAPQTSMFPPDIQPGGEGKGGSVDFAWDVEFSANLRRFSRERGVTVYMLLVAACAALIRAYTGQSDVLLGSPMGVRERTELETLIGPFVNVTVLRVNLADDPSFAQLLAQVRDVVLDAHAHRGTPFEAIIERLRPQRSFDHSPLYQVAVVQHNAIPQVDVTVHGGGALHELTWFIREVEGRFIGALEYRSDLYSKEMMNQILSQLGIILRGGIAHADQQISRLPLTTLYERQQITAWGAGERLLIENATVVQQFERRVTQSPTKTAVSYEEQSIEYSQLNVRANQLARQLCDVGAGPGIVVGICLDRSIELIIALLAVLKSGAAYLPLDPEFPAERLAFMLGDSGAGILLASEDRATKLELPVDVRCLDPAALSAELSLREGANLEWVGDGNDPAYVIYTSGSTGRPKGVVIPHRALVNLLNSMRQRPGLTEKDVLAAVTTVSFDISGLEIYLPLIVGARVELISRETASDGFALADRLASSESTLMQATAATWRLLLEANWQPQSGFRAFCGGETLPRDVADALLARVGELWNLYGPTETTIWSTVDKVDPFPAPITIGMPIANTQVYLLNEHGEPVSIGMPGELWIGGVGVAAGYHNRPQLTAERFVKDRFSSEPDARIYRTGDLARWGRNGRIHHLGRLDQQVKIRGFRIELEEVEATLASYPGIRQACVITAGSNADIALVAYYVQDGSAPTTSELRRYLRSRLPDYMLPSLFVDIDAVPLTPNGKVDRRRLPDPFRSGMRARTSNEPLAPGAEQALADVWRDILKTDEIGPGDNFFELGGHSLLSLRVAAAFLRRTGMSLDPRAMFFQTLREVAMGVGRKVQG